MDNLCKTIMNYEASELYHPIKIDGKWIDLGGQQLRKTYRIGIICPCKQYCNEHCDTNYSKNLEYSPKEYSNFMRHIESKQHKLMLFHKNQQTYNLEAKTKEELIERIEELEREKRKDKVEFRNILEMKEKEHVKEANTFKQQLASKEQTIEAFKSKINIPIANLIDLL